MLSLIKGKRPIVEYHLVYYAVNNAMHISFKKNISPCHHFFLCPKIKPTKFPSLNATKPSKLGV
jgi:hypothetical protein